MRDADCSGLGERCLGAAGRSGGDGRGCTGRRGGRPCGEARAVAAAVRGARRGRAGGRAGCGSLAVPRWRRPRRRLSFSGERGPGPRRASHTPSPAGRLHPLTEPRRVTCCGAEPAAERARGERRRRGGGCARTRSGGTGAGGVLPHRRAICPQRPGFLCCVGSGGLVNTGLGRQAMGS